MKLRAVAVLAAVLVVNACGGGGGGGPSGPSTTTGSVRGSVNDQLGAPVPSAPVTLSATGQANRTGSTAANGSYTFSNLNPGAYTITVTPPSGFQLGSGNGTTAVTVVAGQQANATAIVLTRSVVGPAPQAATVTMTDNQFTPNTVEVAIGGTVTWTNSGATAHNATSSNFTTGNINAGGSSAPVTMPNAGSFPYNCTLHSGMSGTVVVR